jgi:hypothetical protein
LPRVVGDFVLGWAFEYEPDRVGRMVEILEGLENAGPAIFHASDAVNMLADEFAEMLAPGRVGLVFDALDEGIEIALEQDDLVVEVADAGACEDDNLGVVGSLEVPGVEA